MNTVTASEPNLNSPNLNQKFIFTNFLVPSHKTVSKSLQTLALGRGVVPTYRKYDYKQYENV